MQNVWVNARFLTQQVSGVQRFAIELCKSLKRTNPNIRLISPANIIDKELSKELEVTIFGNKTGQLWEQFDLPRFLKKQSNPILLNLCNSAPLLYKRNIITIHDLAFLENPKWFSFSFRMWYNYLIPRIAKKSIHILTVSEFSKKEIQNKLNIDKRKISVVYNGLAEELISSHQNPATVKREKIILSVGSINPRKNLKELINAFNQINIKDYRLLIVGAKNDNFNSEQLDLGNKNIQFLGYLEDRELWELYKKAQLFVYPSLYEGFGIPILEALYFECPTLVANIAPYHEIYENLGLNYVDGNKSKDYENIISNLLNNPINMTKLPEIVLNKYSYPAGARIINNLLDEQ